MPAAHGTPGNRAPLMPWGVCRLSISSGVSIGKLRHEECLRFPKAAGIQVTQAAAGLSALPGPPSSRQPRVGALMSLACVVRTQVGPAVGMASVPTDSA